MLTKILKSIWELEEVDSSHAGEQEATQPDPFPYFHYIARALHCKGNVTCGAILNKDIAEKSLQLGENNRSLGSKRQDCELDRQLQLREGQENWEGHGPEIQGHSAPRSEAEPEEQKASSS